MGLPRAVLVLLALLLLFPSNPDPIRAQESENIWGRIHTVSGEVHEGFIRWDRNEGCWADQLDGSKAFTPFRFQDWWDVAHPGDGTRDRVIELAGYRITWDDDEPEFPESHESGIRFGHIRQLTVAGDDMATLELRSGLFVDLEGGGTDVGDDLREILVFEGDGAPVGLEWEDLDWVEFMAAPPGAQAPGRRLHGTVEAGDGQSFTGYIAWDAGKILTTDTLSGVESDGTLREILFHRVAAIRPTSRGAEVTLTTGETLELFDSDDVDRGNDGILISDPALGTVEMGWDELERVDFSPPERPSGLEGFDGGKRLHGTVVTADSTELTGWIRWDGDEAYTWEILDGRDGDRDVDVEFGKILSIERKVGISNQVEVGSGGVRVSTVPVEGARVTLLDGRVLELSGSNDVDDGNSGVFVLEDGSGQSPDDEEAEWVMVRWTDFRSLRLEGRNER